MSYYNNILKQVSNFNTQAQEVERFVGNPYVKGDNVAEHISRGVRLISYLASLLNEEFGEKISLSDLYTIFIIHDDDEIIAKKDIVTYKKKHNTKDQNEIEVFKKSYSKLNNKYLMDMFTSFRKRNSLEAKIAKQIDNIIGNQLVIEQEIGLIAPYTARFAIEYVEKVVDLSGSKIMKSLINYQIEEIARERKKLLSNPKILRKIIDRYSSEYNLNKDLIFLKAVELLKIDINKIDLTDKKIDLLIQDY